MTPTPRTMRQAFPRATRESLYTFVEADPERRLVGPTIIVLCAVLCVLIFTGVIVL